MKKSRVLALVLAAALLTSGCGTQETGKKDSSEEVEAKEVDLSEKMTFTAFQQADDNPEFTYDNNPVLLYLYDKFNIEIDWQLPPQGSEAEQLTLMLGTGDYTDLIDLSFNRENLTTLCDDGAIWNLTSYIEAYMPNYYAFLNDPANQDVKSALSDDEGNIYTLASINEAPKQWGGLMYRYDILDAMTGGNIAFPSGNENPATIQDWDYMLPLMKQYFEASGMSETACLILPAKGYFENGALLEGFGIGGTDYVDKDGNVQYGIAQDAFYDYLVKMKEWYDEGYIYADFASRTQDLFYLPNTALTYGGAAGIWYGFAGQLGGAMSLPDYGLLVKAKPVASPSTDDHDMIGTTYVSRAMGNQGMAVSTACDEDKLIRILTAFDYLYTEDGGATRTMGLSAEQGASESEGYLNYGLTNGVRENGTTTWTKEADAMADKEVYDFGANRLPGLSVDVPARSVDLEDGVWLEEYGDEVWMTNGSENAFPYTVSFTPDETNEINTLSTNMQDYANAMIVNFIMGREELTEDRFKAYQDQLNTLGLERYLEIKQAAYDRYMSR